MASGSEVWGWVEMHAWHFGVAVIISLSLSLKLSILVSKFDRLRRTRSLLMGIFPAFVLFLAPDFPPRLVAQLHAQGKNEYATPGGSMAH